MLMENKALGVVGEWLEQDKCLRVLYDNGQILPRWEIGTMVAILNLQQPNRWTPLSPANHVVLKLEGIL